MRHASTLVVNRPSVIFDVQGNEAVIIDLATGHYFSLDAAGTQLWLQFAKGGAVEEILEACTNRAELEPEIDGIVDRLIEAGLLREHQPTDDPPAPVDGFRFEHFTLEQFTDLEDILGLDPIHEVDPVKGWPHVAEA